MVGIFLLYPRFTGFFRPRQKLLVYAWNLTCLSLAAQIGTLPLISYYFGEIAVFSLISNLLVSPVLVLLMASASLSIVAVEVPQILMLLQSCTKGLLYYISLIASHIAQDDNAVIMYRASVEHVLWIYLGIFLLAFGMKPSLLKWSLSAGSLLFIVGCILNF
jgi:competence protein ComEC